VKFVAIWSVTLTGVTSVSFAGALKPKIVSEANPFEHGPVDGVGMGDCVVTGAVVAVVDCVVVGAMRAIKISRRANIDAEKRNRNDAADGKHNSHSKIYSLTGCWRRS
jgi:hypothetical protein